MGVPRRWASGSASCETYFDRLSETAAHLTASAGATATEGEWVAHAWTPTTNAISTAPFHIRPLQRIPGLERRLRPDRLGRTSLRPMSTRSRVVGMLSLHNEIFHPGFHALCLLFVQEGLLVPDRSHRRSPTLRHHCLHEALPGACLQSIPHGPHRNPVG